jgi:hypothetical protein
VKHPVYIYIYGKQFLGGQGKGISSVSVDEDFLNLKM